MPPVFLCEGGSPPQNPIVLPFGIRYIGLPTYTDEGKAVATTRTNTSESYGRFRAALTPKVLRELYREHTDSEIASLYEVSNAIVSRYRKEWGIRTVTPRERRDRERKQRGLPTIDDLSPATLAALYVNMGDAQIAAMHGVSKPVIIRLRREWGIKTLTRTDRATSNATLSEEQQEVILGVMLGDGHLTTKGVFQVTHSHSQVAYLVHLAQVLTPLSKPISFGEKIMDSGTVAYEYTLRTAPHLWLLAMRRMFYPEGHRVFPDPVLEVLSPRSLAYWYFDDGHLDSNLPSIALGDVTMDEADHVCRLIRNRFALDTYVRPQSTETCKLLGIRAKTTDIFFSLIVPYLLPEMHHKVPVKFRPSDVKPSRPRLTRETRPFPADLVSRSKSWPQLTEEGQERLLDDLVGFWSESGFPMPSPRVEDLDVLLQLEFNQVVRDGVLRRVNVGQSICSSMMPHMWDTKSEKAKLSPLGVFQDTHALRGTLRMLLRLNSVPNAPRLRSGVRLYQYGGAYNFRPAAAKVLVDRFCPTGGVVFDPCSGWGGRMLGALMSRARVQYIACEPQPETHTCLENLCSWVSEYMSGAEKRVEIHRVPAEDFPFPNDVDMVITSPPYWKKMTYGPQPDLAGNRYGSYQSWLSGFWGPVIEKAVRSLRVGGWLVLNVDDVIIRGELCPLVEDTKRVVRELGLGDPVEVYRYDMGKPGNRDNHEPVMCWSKGEALPMDRSGPSLTTTKCSGCGRVVPAQVEICQRCRERASRLKVCEECGKEFEARRRTAQFCPGGACGARNRRKRAHLPAKTTRTFTCRGCGEKWGTAAHGNFRWCPNCREGRDTEARMKTCAYRACGRRFLDTSPRGSMSYCHPEHRRREKQFRSGKVVRVDQFRKPDPVLG